MPPQQHHGVVVVPRSVPGFCPCTYVSLKLLNAHYPLSTKITFAIVVSNVGVLLLLLLPLLLMEELVVAVPTSDGLTAVARVRAVLPTNAQLLGNS